MRISDWSSDVCSSDLRTATGPAQINGKSIAGVLVQRASAGCQRRGHRNLTLVKFVRVTVLLEDGLIRPALPPIDLGHDRRARSEERRVGKEGVSTCRSRWSPSN